MVKPKFEDLSDWVLGGVARQIAACALAGFVEWNRESEDDSVLDGMTRSSLLDPFDGIDLDRPDRKGIMAGRAKSWKGQMIRRIREAPLADESDQETWDRFIEPDLRWTSTARESSGVPEMTMIIGLPGLNLMKGMILAHHLGQSGAVAVDNGLLAAYMPGYLRILETDPFGDSDALRRFSENMTFRCMEWARLSRRPILFTDQCVDPDLTYARMLEAHDLGFRVHALIMAEPPILSQAVLLDQYAVCRMHGIPARWMSPATHGRIASRLDGHMSDLIRAADRLTVFDPKGEMSLFAFNEGLGRGEALAAWRASFDDKPDAVMGDMVHAACERMRMSAKRMNRADRDIATRAVTDTLELLESLR